MTLQGFTDNFKTWLGHPFSTDMTALQWFYFWGLLIAIGALWYIILSHLRRALESV